MADTTALYKRAEDAFAKRNYDYARDLFLQVLTLDPNHVDARKGLKATILKKYQEQGAPSKLKLGVLAAKVQAELMVAKNNPQKRVEIAQKYLLEDPNNDKVRTALAEALKELGHLDGAMAEATMAIESNPKNGDAFKLLGKVQLDKGLVQECQQSLNTAQKLKPEDREIEKLLRDLAASATMKKGFEEAKSYRDVIKDKDKAKELEKAQHLIKTDEDIKAVLDKLMAEFEASRDAKLARKIGDVYSDNKKDYKTAKEWYQKAVELNPYDSTLKDKVEDMDIKMAELAIARAQQAGDAAKVNEGKMQKLKIELAAWERRKKDRPTDMNVRFELAKRYYMAGQIDAAIADFQQAVKDPKRKVDSHIYLGMCFQKKKLYDLAEPQFKSAEDAAISTDKKMEIWYYHMKCLWDAGKKDRAVEIGKKIMELDYGYKDVAQLVEKYQQA